MRPVQIPPRFDLLLAAAFAVLAVGEIASSAAIAPKAASLAIECGMAAAVAWRRTAPTAAALAVGAGCVLDAAVGVSPDAPLIPMATSITIAYSLVSYQTWRRALLGMVLLLAGVTAQVFVAGQSVANLGFIYTFVVVFLALGRVVRIRTARAVEAEVRVQRLEREHADAVREVAVAERGRIAREMHDVIAHSVSVMVVQAEAAEQVMRTNPDAAERALSNVQTTGRQAVGELGRLLGVLRAGEEGFGLEPQPTLADLPRLVAEAEAAGLRVELLEDGIRHELPGGVELAVYRIIQEALTNTRKHAGPCPHVQVRLGFGPDEVVVEVTDDGVAGPAGEGTGHGLVGMRERISTYGGSLVAQGDDGGFRVTARIPVAQP